MSSRQTGKELVRRAITFQGPERVPYSFDNCRDPLIEQKYGDDFVWAVAEPDPAFQSRVTEPGRYETEFGVVYERIGKTLGEAKQHPIRDAARADDYRLPDFSSPRRYLAMERDVRANPDKYVLGVFPHFLFLQMLDLFGFEHLMFALMDHRDAVERLADRMTESCLVFVERMAERGADGVIAVEDLGVQDRLIIHPDLWREIFKPRMARIAAATHAKGMHFMSHTCGGILNVIEDFIEIGVDVLQIDQQDNMGVDELARRFAGRICFFGPVDIQTTLATATPAQVAAKTRRLMQAFGSKNGGFIGRVYPQPQALNIPEENIRAMCETIKQYGVYPLAAEVPAHV